MVISEFVDTCDSAGVHRRYQAFVIGDNVIARRLQIGSDWTLRAPLSHDDQTREIERRYVFENPHARELLRFARVIGLEYGRVDYGLHHGRVQVWRIRTASPLSQPAHERDATRQDLDECFARRFNAALTAMLGEAHGKQLRRLAA